MTLSSYSAKMLPVIEAELKQQVRNIRTPGTGGFHALLAYHMGWAGKRVGHPGKRIRPLLALLTCASLTKAWRHAVPAAAALELVHNFSLVHDDIQDNSTTRRGRATLWVTAGTPLAINAGDALFALAFQAGLHLARGHDSRTVVTASAILQQACLDLTRGQYLDLYHQQHGRLPLRSYWQMIDGKTAALLAACTHIGALLGGANPKQCYGYRKFGQLLGLAFQVQDDLLGIWGDEKQTGKSADSDLAEGKLSLPVAYALERSSSFRRLWRNTKDRPANADRLRRILEQAGADEYAARQATRLTNLARGSLAKLRPAGQPGAALMELSELLVHRSA